MFSGLRQGSLFYILTKGDTPALQVGQVVAVSNQQTKYGQFQAGFQQDTVVDISVKVGEETLEFKQLPSHLSIANFGQSGVVVSESREAMNAEVEGMIRTSRQVIESVPYHERVVGACNGMLRELNPQYAKEKAQEEKIEQLEGKVCGMEGTLSDIKDMLSRALGNSKKQQQ